MNTRRLTYAGLSYFDRTRPLERGEITPRGVDLEFIPFSDPEGLFRSMAQDQEFDIAEMSLSTLLLMKGRGDDRLVAIPAFPSRVFRHGQVYVNTSAGISNPEDLIGKKVGVPEYQMTAALWIRGFLARDYGVTPAKIDWWVGGLKEPGYVERLSFEAPPGVSIRQIPQTATLEEMLDSGELDALATVNPPQAYRDRRTTVRRLFDDYRAVEEDYLRRTGIFPIMHTVAIRRDVYESNRSIAVTILDAFEAAKRSARDRLRDLPLAVMHPWMPHELDSIATLFGGDPFVYGLPPNRTILETACELSFEQGLSPRRIDPRELFAEETWDWNPVGLDAEPRVT